jgi:DNA repair exonuclease SbcCD ATPase subunit
VYGLNKDAGKESTNSNASGKSLLLTAIPDLRFESSSVPMESRQKASKDAYVKGTKVAITWTNNGKRFTGIKQQPNAAVTYELLREGVAAKNRTAAYFKAKMAELLPWSETEYFNLIHIDSRRNSSLQLGSPAARLQFFTELFKLDDLDAVRGLMKSHLDKHKQSAAVSTELKSQIASIEQQRKSWTTSLTELQTNYNQLETEIEKLRASIKHNQKQMQQAFDSKGAVEAWSVLEPSGKPPRLHQIQDSYDTYLQEQRKLDKTFKLLDRWTEYHEQLSASNKRNAKIKHDISELVSTLDLSTDGTDLAAEKRKITTRVNALGKELARLLGELALTPKATEPEYSKESVAWFKENFDSFDDMTHQIKDAEDALVTQRHTLATTKKNLADFEKLTTSKPCPTCTQLIKSDIKSKVIAGYTDTVDKAQIKIVKIQKWLAKTAACQQYFVQVHEAERWQTAVAEYKPEIDKCEKSIRSLGKRSALIEQVLDLKMSLDPEPSKPKEAEPEIDVDKSNRRLKWLSSTLRHLETVQRYLEAHDELDHELDYAELEAKQSKLQTKLDTKSSSLPSLKVELMQRLETRQRHSQLGQRLAELDADSSKGKWLEILYEAYGSKGIKTLLSKKLAKNLENNMNRNRGLLFREDITFEFVVDANEFSILAHRKYRNRIVTSDVRRLSGAESRAFNFLLPLSLIPMIPSSHRCNVMVLDEPCLNLDEVSQEKFYTQFLPALSKVVPSVIVITPIKDNRIPASRLVLATKDQGTTTLTERVINLGHHA